MSIAFVLGNGISRQAVDPAQLLSLGHVYGCNAIYREFAPTVLVSTDPPISERIQHSGYSKQHVHYTRKPLLDSPSKRIPQQYFGFSSGPAATGIAAITGYQHIYLLGFDLGPTNIGRFNNVYSDTEFYKKSSAAPTYTGNWVRQLLTVMTDHPTTTFFRVMGETTAQITQLTSASNLVQLEIADFLNRINNTKEL